MSKVQDVDNVILMPNGSVVTVNVKEKGVAYLWWLFFGTFGAHQFYMGKTGRAVSMLLTLGWLTVGVWIDLFTIPRQILRITSMISRILMDG